MALPKLNATPNYTVKVPSTGKKVGYRPYLVKEEKVLMIAFETGDQKQALGAVVDTLAACIQDDINVNALTTFDIEYLFTQIRSKSVGEKSTVMLPCSSCETKNEVDIDIASIEVDVPKDKSNIIELTPTVSVEMQYPSYTAVSNVDLEGNETQLGFQMLVKCIAAIHTDEERYDASEASEEELMEFIESMTTSQFQKVSAFLQDMPSLKKEVKFLCEKCGSENAQVLKGIGDFLS
jgi:Zn finger protein HypA/HybF involved in hydrogenase expression